jgi:hypothetical protein
MNRSRWTACTAAAFVAAALAACDNSNKPSLVTDAEINADVAATSGDAMAMAVADMMANENLATLPSNAPPPASNLAGGTVTYSRTRVCYDESFNVVVDCKPSSTVRTVVTNAQLDGTRSGSNEDDTRSWSGAVHRTADDSLTRVFDATTETQRVHNALGTAHDSVTVTGDEKSKFFSEDATDSVKAVTFALPRSENPFPISGSIVRNLTVTVVVTKDGQTETRTVTRRVEVTFPADNQGNVVLKVNATTCNLNLVTGKVTACS